MDIESIKKVKAEMEKERQALDFAIRGIEVLLSRHNPEGDQTKSIETKELKLAAAKEILRAKRKKTKTKEIFKALEKQGIKFADRAERNLFYTHLNRDKEIVRVGRGLWALKEWESNAPQGEAKGGADHGG